jgi:hypothetical protein
VLVLFKTFQSKHNGIPVTPQGCEPRVSPTG